MYANEPPGYPPTPPPPLSQPPDPPPAPMYQQTSPMPTDMWGTPPPPSGPPAPGPAPRRNTAAIVLTIVAIALGLAATAGGTLYVLERSAHASTKTDDKRTIARVTEERDQARKEIDEAKQDVEEAKEAADDAKAEQARLKACVDAARRLGDLITGSTRPSDAVIERAILDMITKC